MYLVAIFDIRQRARQKVLSRRNLKQRSSLAWVITAKISVDAKDHFFVCCSFISNCNAALRWEMDTSRVFFYGCMINVFFKHLDVL
jgi:hypothetical protein